MGEDKTMIQRALSEIYGRMFCEEKHGFPVGRGGVFI